MPDEIKIPEVGESITEVQIAKWLKAEGDTVKPDEAVAVIDSEKTTFELPAPKGGRLVKILHQAGDTVRIGEVVAHIEANGEPVKAGDGKAEAGSGPKPEPKSAKTPKIEAATRKSGDDKKPVSDGGADHEAKGREPEKVTGSQGEEPAAPDTKEPPGDEVVLEESQREEGRQPPSKPEVKPEQPKPATAPVAKPAKSSGNGETEVVPMTMLRRTVARHLVEAKQTMAMLTTFNEIDMSAVQALRHEHQEAFERRHQVKLGLMSFFMKAAIDALKQFPQLNAEIRGDDIIYHNYFDIGVAIATGRGLVVPVLRRAERLSFAELEKTIGDFVMRAKETKLTPDELEGGTFTITNGGVFGSLLSTPIINPPQAGILGMHTVQERPVAVQGQVVIRPMMYVALTYDHRLVDGREAVLFLQRIKEAVETPARMLIEV